jgi:hypothetical protein
LSFFRRSTRRGQVLLHELKDFLLAVVRCDADPMVRGVFIQDPIDCAQLGPADVLDLST